MKRYPKAKRRVDAREVRATSRRALHRHPSDDGPSRPDLRTAPVPVISQDDARALRAALRAESLDPSTPFDNVLRRPFIELSIAKILGDIFAVPNGLASAHRAVREEIDRRARAAPKIEEGV